MTKTQATNKATKDSLLASRLERRDVDVEGVGTVTVRALSRAEVMDIQRATRGNTDVADLEKRMLTRGVVEPALDYEDVSAWYDAAPAGELEPISTAIAELSGMTQNAASEASAAFRERSGNGVGLRGGGNAGANGSGPKS